MAVSDICAWQTFIPQVQAYRAIADWEDAQGHGTHVAGSMSGHASKDGLPTYFGGLAPAAKLLVSDIVGSDGQLDSRLLAKVLGPEYFGFAYSRGARVHSDSWGGDRNVYDVRHAMAPCSSRLAYPRLRCQATAYVSTLCECGGCPAAQTCWREKRRSAAGF